jgi:hypothetical protein
MKSIRVIISIWVAWVFIVIGLQALATARMSVQYPDCAQEWTEEFTAAGYQEGHVFLLEPFMNNQVAWDSEYYLAIAVGGYDDPRSPHLTPRGVSTSAEENLAAQSGSDLNSSISLYAFFPFYPFVMRLFAFPLQLFGVNPIATATLAVVLISWGSGPAQGIPRNTSVCAWSTCSICRVGKVGREPGL